MKADESGPNQRVILGHRACGNFGDCEWMARQEPHRRSNSLRAHQAGPPNVVYFLVDDLGYDELGYYGGGILRGGDTRRIDAFAKRRHEAAQLRARSAMHAIALGIDDRPIRDPIRQPHRRNAGRIR